MKQLLLTLCALAVFQSGAMAQTDVSLEIIHKLGINPFAFDKPSFNNMAHRFKVDRLEYYISQISVIHDGGQETTMYDVYILANAGKPTLVDLGNYDITSVEKVKFSIGVDLANNHADPASFPSSHALAPKNPSMHWGWAAGYRFIAIEGWAGNSFDQLFELHGLGNSSYFEAVIDADVIAENGKVTISLDADYNRILENIAVNSGVIVHAEVGDARLALENMSKYVFSKKGSITSLDEEQVREFVVYPNPSLDGYFNLKVALESPMAYEVVVINMLGQHIKQQAVAANAPAPTLHVGKPGVYFVSIRSGQEKIAVRKLVVR